MAEEIIRRVLDDLHNSRGEKVPAETVAELTLNGRTVRLDLTGRNKEQMEAELEKYFEAGTPVTGKRRTAATTTPAPAPKRTATGKKKKAAAEDSTAIREWARKRGWKVNDRGRIPGEIRDAYYAERGPQPGVVTETPAVDFTTAQQTVGAVV